MNKNENKSLILTLRGIEQYHTHKDRLDTQQSWLIEIIFSTNTEIEILKAMAHQKVDKKNLDFLVDNHYVSYVSSNEALEQQQFVNEQFLMQQTTNNLQIRPGQKSIDAFDFIRSDKKVDFYMDQIDPSDITIMPNRTNDSLYSTMNTSASQDDDSSVSTKTPEVRAFEEIKEVLRFAIKDSFSIKSYVYNYQLNKINTISELNSFFSKLFLEFKSKKGEDYTDDLVRKIKIISKNYGID